MIDGAKSVLRSRSFQRRPKAAKSHRGSIRDLGCDGCLASKIGDPRHQLLVLHRQHTSSEGHYTTDVITREEVVECTPTDNAGGPCDDDVRPIGHRGNFSNILSTSLLTRLMRCSGEACSCTCFSARPRQISWPVAAFSTSTINVPTILSSIVYQPPPYDGPHPV